MNLRVAGLARAGGLRYARYADDLVLSGARAGSTLVAHLGAIAREEGFGLNFRKTRVMRAAQRQRVTGVCAVLHNCARTGPGRQNRDGVPDFRAYLLGRIAWVAQLDAAKGERLRAAFNRIAWTESVVL